MILICIVLLGLGLALWRKVALKYDHAFNHVNLFSSIWLFTGLGALLFPLEVKLLSSTYVVLILSWIFYLIGSYRFRNNKTINTKKVGYSYFNVKLLLKILIGLSILSNLVALEYILPYILNIETWAALRTDQLFGESVVRNLFFALFGRNFVIYIPLAIYLYKNGKIKLVHFCLIFVYSVFISIVGFTRAPLLQLIIVTTCSFILIHDIKRIAIIKAIAIIALFIFLFVQMQYVLHSLIMNQVFDPFHSIKIYLFGGISNYQVLLHGKYPDYGDYCSPYYSLDFINFILNRIGVISSYPNLVRESNPYTVSNVYTYLDAFTLDFGVAGAIIGSLLIGAIGKYFYFSYKATRSIFTMIVYSLICYYSVMVFMNNEFIRFSFLLVIIKAILIDVLCRVKLK